MFRSCAEWPPEVFTALDGSHVSTDKHDTEEQASAVCRMLERLGFGGKGLRYRPIRTWVEEAPT